MLSSTKQSSIYRQSLNRVLNMNCRSSTSHGINNSSTHSINSLNRSVHIPEEFSQSECEKQRLTFKDIQNITKSMLKDRKAHEHNVGVLHNIKGKMYCLKLGEVSNFKEFSHYFYTSQYRRKLSKPQSRLGSLNLNNINTGSQKYKANSKVSKLHKKISTQPSEKATGNTLITGYPTITNQKQTYKQGQRFLEKKLHKNNRQIVDYDDYSEDNQQQIKKIQKIVQNTNTIQDLKIDDKLKQRVHKIVLPMLNSSTKENSKQKMCSESKQQRQRQRQKIFRESLTKKQIPKMIKRYSVNRML